MATGASAVGVPGWPDSASRTASMESVRIVAIVSSSMLAVTRRRLDHRSSITVERGSRIHHRVSSLTPRARQGLAGGCAGLAEWWWERRDVPREQVVKLLLALLGQGFGGLVGCSASRPTRAFRRLGTALSAQPLERARRGRIEQHADARGALRDPTGREVVTARAKGAAHRIRLLVPAHQEQRLAGGGERR